MRIPARFSILAVAMVTLPACPPSSPGHLVPQQDGTPPILSLGIGQPNGQDVTVSAGGSPAAMTLVTKSGRLNLLATARDDESGIQSVEIWVSRTITTCQANGLCQTNNPGLSGSPAFQSTVPQKQPGESASVLSIFGETLDLITSIPQGSVQPGGSRTVTLIIHAVAKNHLGGQSVTSEARATWTEP